MKIVVPYAEDCKALQSVRIALDQDNLYPDYQLMDREDAYHDLFKRLWETGEPFIINEHDIIPWPSAIAQLEACPEPWCTHMYRCACGWIGNGLGLAKFDPKRLPNIFQTPFGNTNWQYLDTRIADRLRIYELQPHIHTPAVTNLNPVVWLKPQRCEMRDGRFLTREEATIV